MVRTILLFLFLAIALVPACFAQVLTDGGSSRPERDTDVLQIEIRPTFNGKTLQLGEQYVTGSGDTVVIDEFRFYVTNVSFGGLHNVTLTNCHLFDAAEDSTWSFAVHIPPGEYNAVAFIAGVDSIANTSGANEGDLDPVKGMYWAWNSGYIMAKLEGHSKVCKTLHSEFEFHIGGYMPPYNTARQIRLPLDFAMKMPGPHQPRIQINADVAAWFRGIDLSKVNSILIPGKEAAMMADNYARMFSKESIMVTHGR